MADTPTVRFESKMMIDGKLVDGAAGTFTNINPATEEALGEVADASKADMHRAIDAARRAFDETDWSTNHAFRQNAACSSCRRRSRPSRRNCARNSSSRWVARARSRTARSSTRRWPTRLRYPAKLIDEYPWETDPRRRVGLAHRREHHAEGLARAGRCRRRDRAVELSVRGHHPQARPGAGAPATPSC